VYWRTVILPRQQTVDPICVLAEATVSSRHGRTSVFDSAQDSSAFTPNFGVRWMSFLVCIWEVPRSNVPVDRRRFFVVCLGLSRYKQILNLKSGPDHVLLQSFVIHVSVIVPFDTTCLDLVLEGLEAQVNKQHI
jgi:hypothetical protein